MGHTVLLVDDDVSTLETFEFILRRVGHRVLTAARGEQGLSLIQEVRPDVVLLDLNLPDMPGLSVLRTARTTGVNSAFVIMTGYATIRSATESMRLGAFDYLEKPLDADDITLAVDTALERLKGTNSCNIDPTLLNAHAAARWAKVVVRACNCPTDPRTLALWAHHVGASPGTIRSWCRTAGIAPKRALDFARILRAVIQRRHCGRSPEDLLDVVDRRTLLKMLRLGSPESADNMGLPTTMEDFIVCQRWITNPEALEAIRRALAEHDLDF